MIFVGLGVKNQFILAKTIDFSLLVQQKSSVENSINDEVHQKRTFKVPLQSTLWSVDRILKLYCSIDEDSKSRLGEINSDKCFINPNHFL